MIIQKVSIHHFGSLRDVELEGLGDFVVFLGKNGVGKSFILEALHHFFDEFNTTGGASAIAANDYLWYGRITEVPIEFELTLKLTDNEINKLFDLPEQILDKIKKACSEEEFRQIKVNRNLIFGGNWKTKSVQLANIQIIKDDQALAPDQLASLIGTLKQLTGYVFNFFTPEHSSENIGGDRLLLDQAKKVAYHSDSRIDSLVSQNIIKGVKVYKTPEFQQVTDWRTWLEKTGYTIIERPPTAEEAPEVSEVLAALVQPRALQQIADNITELIKANFKLIPAARDAKANIGIRHPFIEQDALESLKTLSLSRKRRDEKQWQRYRNEVEQLIRKDLEPNPEQLLVRDGDLGLPPAYTGGGEQAILAFQWWFLDDKAIFAVEEPENHLHPELCRQIFRFLKRRSQNRQVILSTHSPMFIDKKDITNNWVVTCERPREEEYGESKVQQVTTKDDLKLALVELGVLPSDIYLKDFVVFVEGGTEKEAILPILGSKLGVGMEGNIGVISIGGDSRLERFLRIWLEIMEYAPADYLVILDEHSGELALRLSREMNISSSKFHVWKKGSIEDYYPPDLAIEALKELFGIEATEGDFDKKQPLDKELKRILEINNKIRKGWKVEIGDYVARKMGSKRIPNEIKALFERIKSQVEQ